MNSIERNKDILIYLFMCLGFSIILTFSLITYKINCKQSSVISIIFAHFFLICLFYQPFILILDFFIGMKYISNGNERNLEIDTFFEYEYKIIGYLGTFFSMIVLPIYKDYLLSGYFSFWQKLWDATKRRLKVFGIYGIIFYIYIIFGLILFIIKGESGYIIAKDFFLFVLQCLGIPNILNTIWYTGAFLPLFINESKMIGRKGEEEQLRTKAKYLKRLVGIIAYYLDKDKKK